MKITVNKMMDWDVVYSAALYTQGKKPKEKGMMPSARWILDTVIANHSMLRELVYAIDIEDVPNFVINHLVRHVHAQPFVRTMREDITGVPSNEITRLTPNSFRWFISGQELIQASNQRLCTKASKETRDVIKEVIKEVGKIDPAIAFMCVPNCIKLAGCPEYKKCNVWSNFIDSMPTLRERLLNIEDRYSLWHDIKREVVMPNTEELPRKAKGHDISSTYTDTWIYQDCDIISLDTLYMRMQFALEYVDLQEKRDEKILEALTVAGYTWGDWEDYLRHRGVTCHTSDK